jgi:hypothetical protein
MKPAIFKWGVLEGRGMVSDDIPATAKLALPVRGKQAEVVPPGKFPVAARFREITFKCARVYRNGLPLYEADIE